MGMLAINGGKKVREKLFPSQYSSILNEESRMNILKKFSKLSQDGVFSRYRGNCTKNFWGSESIKDTEFLLGTKINCKNVMLVNSCTSALFIACAAIGLKPGDEVIVTPWSMSCSATIPLFFGAVPVFADISYDNFCLSPESIAEKITDKTKAIIVVDLFGNIADYKRIREAIGNKKIYIIEDAAQAIGSYVRGEGDESFKYAGTFGDIGCYSFTQGKHFTAGEGGAIVSNNLELFKRCALIRNHAESVINDAANGNLTGDYRIDDSLGLQDYTLVGGNFRITDIQAAILHEQLLKWVEAMMLRQSTKNSLKDIQKVVPYIEFPSEKSSIYNSYYVLPFYFKLEDPEITRDIFIAAVKAELSEEIGRIDRGVPIGCGYITPLYNMPIFKNDSNKHWAISDVDYSKVKCNVTEYLHKKEFFLTLYNGLPLTYDDRIDIVEAFYKVYKYSDELRKK